MLRVTLYSPSTTFFRCLHTNNRCRVFWWNWGGVKAVQVAVSLDTRKITGWFFSTVSDIGCLLISCYKVSVSLYSFDQYLHSFTWRYLYYMYTTSSLFIIHSSILYSILLCFPIHYSLLNMNCSIFLILYSCFHNILFFYSLFYILFSSFYYLDYIYTTSYLSCTSSFCTNNSC